MTVNILQQHPTFHDIFAGLVPYFPDKLPHDAPDDTVLFTHEGVELAYSPLSGDAYRLAYDKWRNIKRGTMNGYTQVCINGSIQALHRIIAQHFPVTGECTRNAQIDHINHIRDDNRLENLRWVTASQNQRNASKRSDNTSGFKGVYWHKATKKWKAQIRLNGKPKHLGLFTSRESAYIAYCTASNNHHGEFGFYDKAQLRRAIAAEAARMGG